MAASSTSSTLHSALGRARRDSALCPTFLSHSVSTRILFCRFRRLIPILASFLPGFLQLDSRIIYPGMEEARQDSDKTVRHPVKVPQGEATFIHVNITQ